MVSLAERRRGAEHLETEHGVSERRACQVIGIWRSAKRRPSGCIEETKLVGRVHELSERYPRFEYRRIHAVLRSEGFAVGRDRLRLIRKREGLQVARRQRKQRRAGKSTTDVVRVLGQLIEIPGAPAILKSDNGPELVAQHVQDWLKDRGIGTKYIEPGIPGRMATTNRSTASFGMAA